MTAEAIAPAWMHELVTAERYDSWSAEQSAGIEQALTGMPIVHTYVLDMASAKYRDAEVFTGFVKATAPFPVTIDLTEI